MISSVRGCGGWKPHDRFGVAEEVISVVRCEEDAVGWS